IISFKSRDVYSFGFCLLLISLVFFVISVVSVGGLPLLKPSLRYLLKPLFTMPVFLIIPAVALIGSYVINELKKNNISRSQARFRIVTLIAISSAILLSLGYRTHIIAVILIMVIISYYGKALAIWEVVIAVLLAIGLIVGIGYYRSLGELTITSNLSPLYTLQSRADFTLHVLDLLNYISNPFGLTHGSLTLSSLPGSELGPRATIGQLIAWRSEVTVTPTLIGPMLVDFGTIGVAGGMALIGFILGIGYKIIQKTYDPTYIAIYGILLSYTLLGVETGILDITVISYFVLGLIVYIGSIYKSFKNK
ncbi:MAG: oligosaccharide repeat unit polymerase family protein, partial [Methanobacteriaceae archaeon]